MSGKGIKISPKYGVNPTIPVCFFCGKQKNMVALMGKMGDRGEDIEAGRNMIIDYEPCDDCLKGMEQGITLIGVTDIQPKDNRPPIYQNMYPTGTMFVLKEDCIHRIFDDLFDAETVEAMLKKRKCFVDENVLKLIAPGEYNGK